MQMRRCIVAACGKNLLSRPTISSCHKAVTVGDKPIGNTVQSQPIIHSSLNAMNNGDTVIINHHTIQPVIVSAVGNLPDAADAERNEDAVGTTASDSDTDSLINSSFVGCFVNMNGLQEYKFAAINKMLNDHHIDAFCVVEHKKKFKTELPEFQGYNRWAKCRQDMAGGGVAIWIRNRPGLKAYLLPLEPWPEDYDNEQLWVVLDFGFKKVCLACIYIKPQGPHIPVEYGQRFLYLLQTRVLELSEAGYDICVMGDFNAHITHPAKPDTTPQDDRGAHMVDMAATCGLQILNSRADSKGIFTRCPEGRHGPVEARDPEDHEHQVGLWHTKTLIDYIMFGGNSLIPFDIFVDEDRVLGIESDHVPIKVVWKTPTQDKIDNPPDDLVTRWNITPTTDWEPFKLSIQDLLDSSTKGPHIQDPSRDTVQAMYDRLMLIICQAGEDTIDVKHKRKGCTVRESKAVIIRRSRYKESKFLLKRAIQQRRHWLTIRRMHDIKWGEREELRKQIRREQDSKLHKFADSLLKRNDRNSMNLYKYVRVRRAPVVELFSLKEENGDLITDPARVKDKMQEEWESIFDTQHWPHASLKPPPVSLRLEQSQIDELEEDITLLEVQEAIKDLHSGTSSGTTDLPPDFIKHAPMSFVTEIWEWCMVMWKTKFMPIENDETRSNFLHKKGSTDTLKHYRTLTTGCNMCKVYLRILYNRLAYAVEDSGLLGEIQNGFRKRRRAMDNILVLDTVIRHYKRTGRTLSIALLDITKAYDRICRDTLWYKLECYGFPPTILQSLKSVYHNPTSVLVFQGIKTDPLFMPIGLRQGCVLSPILFALYIADLGRELEECGLGAEIDGHIIPGIMFADDIVLFGSDRALRGLCAIVKRYAAENKMEVSGPKSSVIPINRKVNPNTEWIIGNVPIREREGEPIIMLEENGGRYLGISWQRVHNIYTPQMNIALAKATKVVGIITYLLKRTCNPVTLVKKLWETYALPAVLYGMEVMSVPQNVLDKLEVIQNTLIKHTFKLPSFTSTAACYAISGLHLLSLLLPKRN